MTNSPDFETDPEKLKADIELRYHRGEINPFGGWSPDQERKALILENERTNLSLYESTALFLEKRSHIMNEVTARNYKRHFKMLMDKLGSSILVRMIRKEDIEDFCFKPHLKPATQASYLRHIKVLFRWLHEEEIIEKDITAKIRKPKVPNTLADKVISEGQFDKIIDAYNSHNEACVKAGSISSKVQLRLWFEPMMTLIFYTGIRVSEAVSLRWEHVKLGSSEIGGSIMIMNTDYKTTKSGKERGIPLRRRAQTMLKNWYLDQGKPQKGFVFPRVTSKSNEFPMNTQAVSKTFKKFARLADMSESITLHSLRHSSVTNLLRNNVDLALIRDMHGHSSLAVTENYIHLNFDDLNKAITKLDEENE